MVDHAHLSRREKLMNLYCRKSAPQHLTTSNKPCANSPSTSRTAPPRPIHTLFPLQLPRIWPTQPERIHIIHRWASTLDIPRSLNSSFLSSQFSSLAYMLPPAPTDHRGGRPCEVHAFGSHPFGPEVRHPAIRRGICGPLNLIGKA